MFVLDGKLQSFDTHVKVRCPSGESRGWRWYPANNSPVPFHQDGVRFRVIERFSSPSSPPPVAGGSTMHGRLAGDGRSVSGTIYTRAVWTLRDGPVKCVGATRFSARAQG